MVAAKTRCEVVKIDAMLSLAVPLEMLLTNLFVIDRCSSKRYSVRVTYAAWAIFVVALFVPCSIIASHIPQVGNGNGLFVFVGFLYAIPIALLYTNTAAKTICLACTSWVYSFALFSISVHTSSMITTIPQAYSSLAIQTLLYVVSFAWFYRKLKYNLFPMLSQMNDAETKSLMWMGIMWFWTVFIINLAFVYSSVLLLRVLAIASFAVCAYNFYWYTYRVIHGDRAIKSLEQIAYHDSLTQLRTRSLMTSDVEQLITRGIPFNLVFLDLNNFKQINDEYGHNVGDEYLAFFAQETKVKIGNNGGFYRIAGDEFVGVLIDGEIGSLVERLSQYPDVINEQGVPFYGVSFGVAAYPDDAATLKELLEVADARMYENKRRTKMENEPNS